MTKIHAFRLVKKRRKNDAFSGEGAKLFGGRWNSQGNAVVYTASSASLAVLEVMVYLNNPAMLKHFAMLEIAIPADSITPIKDSQLPDNWRAPSAPLALKRLGDAWIENNQTAALRVRSAVIPLEMNYVLNVNHADFDNIVASAKDISFDADPRLLQ